MPAAVVPKNALAIGAGYLYYANLGTGLPANTVAGSVFTDAWPGGFSLLGVTKEGHEFDYELSVDQIEAAEYLDPLQYVTTGRTSGMKFELQQIHATNMRRVLNGGTITTSGAGATLLSTYTPPVPGTEIRCIIGWEATDNTERLIMEQAFQIGALAVNRKKGADNATLPVEFRGEVAASGQPFQYFTAGVLRG
jgi:hypothetical protein